MSLFNEIPFEKPKPLKGPVTYDKKSILINGKRTLIISGAIHYPRSPTSHWDHLFELAIANNLNSIETYFVNTVSLVMYTGIKQVEGQYDFETGNKNLKLFIQKAEEHGLYVIIRIGPYICAEWNGGGIPGWLSLKENISFRTYRSMEWRKAMERFLRKTVDIIRPQIASNDGGNVILLQVENEFGVFNEQRKRIGPEEVADARNYVAWAANLANSLDVNIPWIMCQEGDVPTVINTCNGNEAQFICLLKHFDFSLHAGFFCDNWVNTIPNQPRMFTEAAYLTQSYDYDAPINEFGFENIKNGETIGPENEEKYVVGKFEHLANLHKHLIEYSDVILSGVLEKTVFNDHGESHFFGTFKKGLTFLSNWGKNSESKFSVTIKSKNHSVDLEIDPWSVTIVSFNFDEITVLYTSSQPQLCKVVSNRAISLKNIWMRDPFLSKARTTLGSIKNAELYSAKEPIFLGSKLSHNEIFPLNMIVNSKEPIPQLKITKDETDYLWYCCSNIELKSKNSKIVIFLEKVEDFFSVYFDGREISVNKNSEIDTFTVQVNDSVNTHTLSILTSTLGLEKIGLHYENSWVKGIIGDVYVDEIKISENGNWEHFPGLYGERKKNVIGNRNNFWKKLETNCFTKTSSFTWFKYLIPKAEILKLIPEKKHQTHSTFCLNLRHCEKGYFFVNGIEMGRFYLTPIIENKKATNQPSQEIYHVPSEFLFDESLMKSGMIELVFFEEVCCDLRKAEIIYLQE
ncbi:Beta-galactosidase 6 [Clydaea vesicula]|uniref:Beta-galactosidase 6 n=1 Tax=Clydaea vesicula TaxID=447962 RepID=A0AAD5XVK2_9FUNG|nr:Beta-galactosidase 6 [Clydaea vesicula]